MNANSSKKITLYDPPRTADAEVEAAKILEPFSNSSDPLFHARIPCCIHLGKFSYASCNLPSKSLKKKIEKLEKALELQQRTIDHDKKFMI